MAAEHEALDALTRCPGCATVFRITAEQLAFREGQVRCGQCRAVFDANDHLVARDLPPRDAPFEAQPADPVQARQAEPVDEAASDATDEPAAPVDETAARIEEVAAQIDELAAQIGEPASEAEAEETPTAID